MNNTRQNTINISRHLSEFKEIMTAKNYNLVGRELIFSEINNSLNVFDRVCFDIIGESGIGKTAILGKSPIADYLLKRIV